MRQDLTFMVLFIDANDKHSIMIYKIHDIEVPMICPGISTLAVKISFQCIKSSHHQDI